jgi:hypothetical protein
MNKKEADAEFTKRLNDGYALHLEWVAIRFDDDNKIIHISPLADKQLGKPIEKIFELKDPINCYKEE